MKKKIVSILLCAVLSLSVVALAACGGDEGPGGGSGGTYTYNYYQPASPDKWNPHTYETSTDSEILGYNTIGLYDFILNDTLDGYEIIPEMAAEAPMDVTTSYASNATYGVPAGETKGYAWRIKLNQNAKWDNGDVINADSYLYSMEKMLDPTMLNRRADSYYSGQLVLANAESYLKQKSATFAPVAKEVDKKIVYADVADDEMYISVSDPVFFLGVSIKDAVGMGYEESFVIDGVDYYEKFSADCEKDKQGMTLMTEEYKTALIAISANFGDTDPNAYKQWTFYKTKEQSSTEVSFDNVGIKKVDEYTFDLILKNQLSLFYIQYNLASPWLVHKKTYEDNMVVINEGYKKTSYCTDLASTRSFGPYKLTSFQNDKQFTLAKNDKWYGYTDGKHVGQFKTTNIVCDIISEELAFEQFLLGKFDYVSMNDDQMRDHKSSKYWRFTPDSNTGTLVMNANRGKLLARQKTPGENKTILANLKFRKAIALAIDNATYVNAINPAASAGFGLLNNAYIADPDTGVPYREYDDAKKAIVRYNDIEYGEGKKYATLDEAYDAVTNYDLNAAKELFIEAYEEELASTEDGHIVEGDKIVLEYGVPASDPAWGMWGTLVLDAMKAATVGTALAGKIDIKVVVDKQYADTMASGGLDMCRGMWGGSDMDPFSIMQVFLDPGLKFEAGIDGDAISMTYQVKGETAPKTLTLNQWHAALVGAEGAHNYSNAAVDTKVGILAELEYTLLSQFNTVPLYWRGIASLSSKQIKEKITSFVPLAGFGGIRFMDYEMNDAEWEVFCKTPSNLNYK